MESISEAYSDIAPDASSKFYSILLSTQPAVAAAVAEIIETAIETLFVDVPGWSRELPVNATVISNLPEITGTPLDFIADVLPASQEVEITSSLLTGG